MKRLITGAGILLMLLLAAPEAYSQYHTGEKYCMPADELEVEGSITHTSRRKAVLSGNAINHSSIDYEDARIAAELLDNEQNLLRYIEFTVGDDIEADESEAFSIRLRDAEDVAFVRYKLVCASRPVIEP